MPAPIALFVYNRPVHTLRTLNCLKANQLASESELFIFSDGPKQNANKETLKSIDEVRNIIRSQKWCKEVHIAEKKVNHGLAESLIEGITKTILLKEKLIILEDDLIFSPLTLEYFNRALDLYHDREQIMSVSGFMFPVAKKKLPDSFFLQLDSSWGWATWSRAWKKFQPDATALKKKLQSSGKIKTFNAGTKGEFSAMLDSFIRGEIDSWAIRWYASIVLENGLTLFPKTSFVNNTGMDGSGVHKEMTEKYFNKALNNSSVPDFFPEMIVENEEARRSVEKYFSKHDRINISGRIKQVLKSLAKRN